MRNIFISFCIIAIFLGTHNTRLRAQGQFQAEAPTEISQGEENTSATPILIDQPLQIWTFIDDYRIITGKTLHLTVQVLWKLGITVNLEGIDKINLPPFKVEGVTMGERQIFDNEHDYQVVTYALSLPSDIKEGIYSIPSFSLSYRNELDKSEGKAVSSPVAIKKVPILVEEKVDKDVITIGDRIHYALTIRQEKNVKLLWENIEKLDFSPFEILKKDVEKQTEGTIEKILINYTLSLYELGGKKKTPEIPGLTILYYVEPLSQHNGTKTDTGHIETKETKTAPIPIIVNSLLKAVDVPLEGIKGPMYYSRKYVFLHEYLPISMGVALLLFLCVTTARSTAKRFSSITPKPARETPRIALERLKNAIHHARKDPSDIENVYNSNKALRTYLGTILDISTETAQSAPTSRFLTYDTQKQLSEEISTITHMVLKQVDTLIFGRSVDKETVEKVMQEIEEIIRLTSSKFLN